MIRVLVEKPNGLQEIYPWGHPQRVDPPNVKILWDERKEGPLPSNVVVGSMKKVGVILVVDQTTKDKHDAAVLRSKEIGSILGSVESINTFNDIKNSLIALVEKLKDLNVI